MRTRLTDGTKFVIEPQDVTLNVKENVAINDVIYEAPEGVADVSTATFTYEMLATGDYEHFTFDASTRQLKVKNSLDADVSGSKSTYTVTIRATATDGADVQYTDKVVTINVTDINDEAPSFGSLQTITSGSDNYIYNTSILMQRERPRLLHV